jgi:hypothetical protein
LRLEKFHYRVNFAKGILESRNVTYDRSMRKLAKPLPVDTPTTIELAPGNSIRVTLIDANHCVGAVMFLIEGDGKAILYTGDIRAETWWVNSLVPNPVLLPYTLGNRRLDCLYLDTTFATKSEPYKEFPSKAEGIRELLEKISHYSDDTVFYFHSWTFGYENVWIALSAFLRSRIHLDDYRTRIYGSLSTMEKRQLREIGLDVQSGNKTLRESGLEVREAPALCGFKNGNHIHPGILTSQESVRIHSCERGMGCAVMDHDTDAKIIHIIPIITRTNGVELAELGAGGGKGDLDQKEELETGDVANIGKLMGLCAKTIKDEELLSKVLALLQQALAGGDGTLDLDMRLQKSFEDDRNDLSLQSLVSILSSNASKSPTIEQPQTKTIRFPYSRHSSYSELCQLVAAFKPKDVFPCTVDEEAWTPDASMESLFGEYCNDMLFRHDAEMMEQYNLRLQREKRDREQIQEDTQTTDEQPFPSPVAVKKLRHDDVEDLDVDYSEEAEYTTPVETLDGTKDKPINLEEIAVPNTSSTRAASRTAVPHLQPNKPATSSSAAIPSKTDASPPPTRGPVLQPLQHTAPSDTPKKPATEATPSSLPLASSTRNSLPVTPLISTMPSCAAPLTPATLPKDVKVPLSTLSVPTSSIIPPTTSARKAQKRMKMTNRQIAYEAAIGTHLTWADYGGLTCTRRKEDREEKEL